MRHCEKVIHGDDEAESLYFITCNSKTMLGFPFGFFFAPLLDNRERENQFKLYSYILINNSSGE